ncbi:putative toxin-antitoxin system toxin component, PIN family [Candidatus Roizmanbacteria bacterium CG_4_9_14_0_2_um_filter_39_13]|uniref:Putative toxin-antitoxin system toxin component, PIN family n=1 Tax=Candidatus Roizmanbacteria bacterium CG_4_9_14_0_2_um_filter_39_13 TaxID=1974839 RepID=A0A2M8EYW1_9BACT|nr:MAG: putative toxin-antitoxin system toxin component, PIN family [Candidatus Roizmanbacteria bacterium CG_4_9_14_0_2_um_filter_39_13]
MIPYPTVVIDTNILISALLSSGNCSKILDMLVNDEYIHITSKNILNEVDLVGKRDKFRKYFSIQTFELFLSILNETSTIVEPAPVIPSQYQSLDSSDNIFVATIFHYRPDFFITGNTKHFMQINELTHIISPDKFITLQSEK